MLVDVLWNVLFYVKYGFSVVDKWDLVFVEVLVCDCENGFFDDLCVFMSWLLLLLVVDEWSVWLVLVKLNLFLCIIGWCVDGYYEL